MHDNCVSKEAHKAVKVWIEKRLQTKRSFILGALFDTLKLQICTCLNVGYAIKGWSHT